MDKNLPANLCQSKQQTPVLPLVWEDSTQHRAAKAHEPQLLSPCSWSPCSTVREATQRRSVSAATRSGPCSPQPEKGFAKAVKIYFI